MLHLHSIRRLGLLVWAVLGLGLAACGKGPTPITVYITPTVAPTGTVVPQNDQPALAWQSLPGPATQLVSADAQVTASPTPGTYGPIIKPDTTLQPVASVTPLPTQAPASLPTLAGTPLPVLQPGLLGIQIHPDLSSEELNLALDQAKELGVKWVKFQFAWDLLEPEPGATSELWGRYRLFVQAAYGRELDVLVSIVNAPDWARSSTEEEGPPSDPQALADILTRLLHHIDRDLYGYSPIDAIEIWNEPNLRREWNGGTLSGADYMRYFDAAYQAIRAAPGGQAIVVVTAGLAPTGINDGVNAVDDRVYLRQMYQAGLNNPAYQNIAVGMHPYSAWNAPDARWCGQDVCSDRGYDNHPSFFFSNTIEDYAAIMQEYGDNSRKLWATEFGWATFDGLVRSDGSPATAPDSVPYFNYIDDRQMGDYIIRAFEIGQQTSFMGPMFLWNLNYAGAYYVDNQDPRAGYAIYGHAVDPKRPAYYLLQQAPKATPQGQ